MIEPAQAVIIGIFFFIVALLILNKLKGPFLTRRESWAYIHRTDILMIFITASLLLGPVGPGTEGFSRFESLNFKIFYAIWATLVLVICIGGLLYWRVRFRKRR